MNPRKAHTFNGFQDRRDQPLCHPSAGVFSPGLVQWRPNAAYTPGENVDGAITLFARQ